MDAATLLTLAQTILQALDSSFVKELGALCSFKSHLAKIKDTMDTVNAVLLDAEEDERHQLQRRNVDRVWFEKLKDAVYDADDLFDKVAYVAQCNKQLKLMSGNRLIKEVYLFFSCSNYIAFAYHLSREVRKIREKLDDIAKDRFDFGLCMPVSAESRIMTKRRDDSHCFVKIGDVIGRDEDKKKVIDMVLDSSIDEEDVSFVTIVGIGGLGKTTLAQLVYNDEIVDKEFKTKMWVHGSDEFDVKALLCKMLSPTKTQGLEMNELQRRVRKKILGKKYLLVLDDIWNEDRDNWLKLRECLIGGDKGSKIIVTTRSRLVATVVGGGSIYELEGLSEEDSWCLFEKMAFERDEKKDVELIEIGKDIIKKCANVPLAIRVISTLLYGQGKRSWLSIRNSEFAKIKQDDRNGVLPILKLSYHHLTSPLKICFSYCALFPKDYRIEKQILFGLWKAHGFILPLEGQSVEEVAEEYFMILLQRCFFQDIERNKYGEIVSCKVHDLMHHVAQDVAGTDIVVINSAASELMRKVRHLSFTDPENILSTIGNANHIRTLYQLLPIKWIAGDAGIIFSKARFLRVLSLHHMSIIMLPNTIGKLVHLRFLDLSYNDKLRSLPTSICKLQNLQTLNLEECGRLKVLPRNFSKLVNLEDLNISRCWNLTSMPPAMSNLSRLHRLPKFVVRSSSKTGREGQLEDLEALTKLSGSLEIIVYSSASQNVRKVRETRCIRGMDNLKNVLISLNGDTATNGLLEGLQPPPNLEDLTLSGYGGVTFPDWESSQDLAKSVPNLENLYISFSSKLQYLPLLSGLCRMKKLELHNLDRFKYIENGGDADNMMVFSGSSGASSSLVARDDQSSFFPVLEKLVLDDLPNLIGWRKSGAVNLSCGNGEELTLLRSPYTFPQLMHLQIKGCPNLTSIPLSLNLKELNICGERDDDSSPSFVRSCNYDFTHLLHLNLWDGLKSLSIVELFRNNVYSIIHSLFIREMTAMKELHLCGLDDLKGANLNHCHVTLNALHVNLRDLHLHRLTSLVILPQGIQYLTCLQSLKIIECDSLTVIPEWISCLNSLQSLYILQCKELKSLPEAMRQLTSLIDLWISGCPSLKERCQNPTGEDWPKIEHIPDIHIL